MESGTYFINEICRFNHRYQQAFCREKAGLRLKMQQNLSRLDAALAQQASRQRSSRAGSEAAGADGEMKRRRN